MQFDFFTVDHRPQIKDLIESGALFVVNHSGGKDSQAMFIKIRELVPADQILVIHADLPGADWAGTWEHIKATVAPLKPLKTVATKTFLDMVEQRGMWPSPKYRQCTSDLKRGPIEREIRQFLKANPRFQGQIVNCIGLRAEESSNRAKKEVFKRSVRNSKAGRSWFDWLPIHEMTTAQVFATIRENDQKPHWAYSKGMERLSCMFCIMATPSDLATSASLNPEAYAQYVELEKRLNFTFAMPVKGERKFLEELTGITAQTPQEAPRPG